MILCSAQLTAQHNHKISSRLSEQMNKSGDEPIAVICLLKDQLDVFSLHDSFRERNLDQQSRINELIPSLQQLAEREQDILVKWIESKQDVKADEINRYWIVNALGLNQTSGQILELAAHSAVKSLDWNAPIEVEEHSCEAIAPVVSPNGSEASLDIINARPLWEMGYTGYGTMAFSADTGIDPFHPSYSNRWMGSYTGMQGGWFDFGPNDLMPKWCTDHGTHTLGTMVGLDRLENDTIGVAFNASWVGGTTICNGSGTEGNLASFQWSLNPDGDLNTISDIPTVINNSWYDPTAEDNQCTSMYVDLFEVLEAAGVAVVFSAGNGGSNGEASITPPKNINTSLVNVFCVGNIDGTDSNNLVITPSSSIGPSVCGGEGSLLIKPEVSAPGRSIRSCEPDRTYGLKTGTSMSAPHVAGAICLLKEAFPNLLSEDLKLALYYSAVDLGEPGEDNTFGTGLIDVLAAYNYLIDQGHVPTAPASLDLDLIGVDSNPTQGYCQGGLEMKFFVENGGATAISSFDYTVQLYDYFGNLQKEVNDSWSGMMLEDHVEFVSVSLDDIAEGEYFVNFISSSPNGMTDPRPLNNAVAKAITVSEQEAIAYNINSEIVATFCEGSQVLLTGSVNVSGTFELQWYNDYQGLQLLGSGNEWLSPPITSPKEIFVKANLTSFAGPQIPETGVYTSDNALRLSVINPVKLETVDVFIDSPGPVIVAMTDIDDNILKVKNTICTTVGKHTLDLNFDLETGIRKLKVIGGKKLLEKTEGLSYPYVAVQEVAITGSDNGSSVYPYFYDLKFSREYSCDPHLINLEPGAASTFQTSIQSVDIAEVNEAINFTSSNPDFAEIQWFFGDGSTSSLANPTHQYEASGNYLVSMVVVGPEGCSQSFQKEVEIQLASSSIDLFDEKTVYLFPNPTLGHVTLELSGFETEVGNIKLLDITGKMISSLSSNGLFDDRYEFNLSHLAKGIYFLNIQVEGQGNVTERIVIY